MNLYKIKVEGLLCLDYPVAEIGDGSARYTILGLTNIKDQNWHQITCTWNEKILSYYCDGKLEASSEFNVDVLYSNTDLFIGNNFWKDHCTDGIIDEVRIYDNVLTENQITDLYNKGTNI
jgi:hypothetical protein